MGVSFLIESYLHVGNGILVGHNSELGLASIPDVPKDDEPFVEESFGGIERDLVILAQLCL